MLMIALVAVLWPTGLDAERSVFRASSRIMSVFALPGEAVTFDLATYAGRPREWVRRFAVEGDVAVRFDEDAGFVLTAPAKTGVYPVVFREPTLPDTPSSTPFRVHVIVMRPATEVVNGMLNGYPVGTFPRDQAGERWRFERPRGFVEITESNRDILLSDHFTLGDLDCKLEVPYPHYSAIKTSLLVKLEALSYKMLERGLPGHDIKVMSAFRTPEYNRSIGNRTTFSRHIAGDAADIFVDANGDDRMDDLNGDGRINRRDSRVLLALINTMDQSQEFGPWWEAPRPTGPIMTTVPSSTWTPGAILPAGNNLQGRPEPRISTRSSQDPARGVR
jgi:hypothetical protein